MPLRSKLIILGVVMLLLFLGLAVGSYLSLSRASSEAEAARVGLEKLTLVDALERDCESLSPIPDPVSCERARIALADLERHRWLPRTKRLLAQVLGQSRVLHSDTGGGDIALFKTSVGELKKEILREVQADLRRAEEPTHRRAVRLLIAAGFAAVGGAATFAWFYSRLVRERRQLEDRVRRSEKLAALGTLAGGLAHEINNPLAAISMAAEALAERLGSDSEAVEFCLAIQEETARCRDLIADLSDLARGGAVDRGPVDLLELYREAARIVRRNAALPEERVQIRVPDHLPLISADRGKLLQLLVNLLQNALEASGGGGPVRLSARSENGTLLLQVVDKGQGIPGHLLDRIFEPFFTNKENGVGLGLTLCHRIAELHGGELTATSAGPGHGAVFTLILPAEAPADGS